MGHAGKDEPQRRARLERLPRVTAQYLRCVPVYQIAQVEGVSTHTIYRDLKYARKVWMKSASANMHKHIAKELAKLDVIEREAWECHELQKKKQFSTRKTTNESGETTNEIRKKSPMLAATWMQVILNCMERRAKLLKLDSDEHSHAGVMQATIVEVVVDTPEQVKQIISYKQFQALTDQSEVVAEGE